RAVRRDGPLLGLEAPEKGDELLAQLVDPRGEPLVGRRLAHAPRLFRREEILHGLAGCSLPREEDAHRAAVDRELFDVHDLETDTPRDRAKRRDRPVEEMLVVDGVELAV